MIYDDLWNILLKEQFLFPLPFLILNGSCYLDLPQVSTSKPAAKENPVASKPGLGQNFRRTGMNGGRT